MNILADNTDQLGAGGVKNRTVRIHTACQHHQYYTYTHIHAQGNVQVISAQVCPHANGDLTTLKGYKNKVLWRSVYKAAI